MVTQTSLNAYQELQQSGTLTSRQEKVHEWMEKYGPCTTRELHKKVVLYEDEPAAAVEGPNYVQPRVTELKEYGTIREVGSRECSVTGITATVLNVERKT